VDNSVGNYFLTHLNARFYWLVIRLPGFDTENIVIAYQMVAWKILNAYVFYHYSVEK
jgi:hypothetical protein